MGKGILPFRAGAALAALLSILACGRPIESITSVESSSLAADPATLRFRRDADGVTVRAAYFYSYMSFFHLDSLAAVGIDRALIKWIGDSLGTRGRSEMAGWLERSARTGVEVTPAWSLQSRARLAALATPRRYVRENGVVEANVGCPLDADFWRSTMLDRADELLAAGPGVRRLLLDLEIYTGSIHHYRDPCHCDGCWRDHRAAISALPTGQPAPSLAEFEERQLTRLLSRLLAEFASAHPGVELGVFDLDYDSFVHRAMARSLVQAGVPTVDYTERSYRSAGNAIPVARAALERLGVDIPVIGGLNLARHMPGLLPAAIRSVTSRGDGYFLFTTFSLWVEPSRRIPPYVLLGTPERYWDALRIANR